MGAILTGILYAIIGAIALVLAVVIVRFVLYAIVHLIRIILEYLWHNLLVVAFVGACVALLLYVFKLFT